jgi:hypothetical protein
MDWATLNASNRLKTLLGPPPVHPWAGLIPQVLLWSFRRFCIQHLISSTTEHLTDHLWEDHLDLIRQYAPKGLETVSASWMTPENIQYLAFSLDDLNILFIDFIGTIDYALDMEDEDLQGKISEFLDDTIRKLIFEWLVPVNQEILIYPMREELENEFTDLQFMRLIQSLLTYSKRRSAEIQATMAPVPAPVAAPSNPEETPDDDFHDLPEEEAPAQEAPAAPAPPAESVSAPQPPPTTPLPPPPPPPPSGSVTSAAAALKHRRTMRRHGNRANRGKTLRTSRIRQKTRKVSLPLG